MARPPKLQILQWNCRGFKRKRESLQQYIESLEKLPDIIALQDVNTEAKLRPYSAHQTNSSTCILVHKDCTAVTIELELTTEVEHTFIQLLPNVRTSRSAYVLNIYSRPKSRGASFDEIFQKAAQLAKSAPLIIVGDFNAYSFLWGYSKEDIKGRKLAAAISDVALTILTDPQHPTRIGNSVSRDTCPDLSLIKGARNYEWHNTQETLGSDHCILKICLDYNKHRKPRGQARLTDWSLFRKAEDATLTAPIEKYEEWAESLLGVRDRFTRTLQTSEEVPAIDNHLLHIWEARRGLTRRWKRQKYNRKLKIKIAELTSQAEEYAWTLAKNNWLAKCDSLKGSLGTKAAWRLLRCLIEPTKSRGEQQRNLKRALHGFAGTDEQLVAALTSKYICTMKDNEPVREYEGMENPDLDREFEVEEIQAALMAMRRSTAPGNDNVTVGLLANLNRQTLENLTQYINECWRSGKLPRAWKTADVSFIPKPGKEVNINNLRPISLTSCAGKLMEKAVQLRLSTYLEDQDLLPHTMFGFRAHLSTQDVLLQLKMEVIDPPRKRNSRAILALDLKGAFDNVKHSKILENLQGTHCGKRTFYYIKDFLQDRQAHIKIGDTRSEPILMGTRGTPQGAVLSPLLFNVALMHLPEKLNAVKGIRHALYADDITIWTTEGSLGQMEGALQEAATTVENYAAECGLRCSPDKSELLVLRRKGDTASLEISVHDTPIPEVETLRILGLLINNKGVNAAAITKLRTVCEQVIRMISRITTKKRGMQEKDTLRLVQAFILCRIVYVAPYLRIRKSDLNHMDVIIRTAYKKALGLPMKTSTERLLQLGVHNTADELISAHLTSQVMRLATTKTGRKVLEDLNICFPQQVAGRQDIPREWRNKFLTLPLPKNMHPEHHQARRVARSKMMNKCYSRTEGAFFVDAAGPVKGISTISVVHQMQVVDGLSVRDRETLAVEEVAIALAATHSASEYIITDSQAAYRNYMRGRITPLACKILSQAKTRAAPKQLIWVPGHEGVEGNERAHASARAFLPRDPSTSSFADFVSPSPLTTYSEILQHLRLERQTLPGPARGLNKSEECHLRRLQTMSFNNPSRLHAIEPESFSAQCKFCGQKADLYHMVWACQKNSSIAIINQPTWEDWEAALSSSDLEEQRALIERARAAAFANGVPD